MGRMSSNRMPGSGKSGNWRRAPLSFTLRLASSAEAEAPVAERLPWEALLARVGSGLPAGGWAAVWAGESLEADMAAEGDGEVDMGAEG